VTIRLAFPLSLVVALAGCGASRDDSNTWTLYRASAVAGDPISRYHVATFDASEAPPYNKQNCEIVARLWAESGVQVRYWCESGRFHL
jgi:hypothetical protein